MPDPALRLYTGPGANHSLVDYVPTSPVEKLDLNLLAQAENCASARLAIKQLSTGLGIDEARSYDIVTAVGEAVGNAVEHAYFDSEPGEFLLKAWKRRTIQDEELIIQVVDFGTWREPRIDDRGRGIMIMRHLAKSMKVENTSKGTKVTMVFSIKPPVNLFQERQVMAS
jgi:anti-sigma regulatory factor (Ser/Thr protein kinase)